MLNQDCNCAVTIVLLEQCHYKYKNWYCDTLVLSVISTLFDGLEIASTSHPRTHPTSSPLLSHFCLSATGTTNNTSSIPAGKRLHSPLAGEIGTFLPYAAAERPSSHQRAQSKLNRTGDRTSTQRAVALSGGEATTHRRLRISTTFLCASDETSQNVRFLDSTSTPYSHRNGEGTFRRLRPQEHENSCQKDRD